ncbi:glycosyltransferase [Marinifilum sp. D737]|uniref:glycosyltransferase n=1 Tax=Marinifilum sp. D737 TaxID=2969628 RepID=UPI002274EE78|nr:glycosyltransferase [Marinifilum sp. D737]MCY1634886.1 glycosyltransferase [Marinifilum sp. D737]
MNLNILHLTTLKKNNVSGMSFSVPNLIEGQVKNESNVVVFNLYKKLFIDFTAIRKFDVVCLHSFYKFNYILLLFFLKRQTPIVLVPRGAFSRELGFSTKKKIYHYLFFIAVKLLRVKVVGHYLTENEKKLSIHNLKESFVLGNCLKVQNDSIDDSVLTQRYSNKNIVFLGRYLEKIKGLDLLIQSIVENKEVILSSGLKFTFYGADNEYKNHLKGISKKSGLDKIVILNGPVFGEEKEKVLRGAYFSILPSRSEGFPMSVLESCQYGVPQILSEGTNLLDELYKFEFGCKFDENYIKKIGQVSLEEYLRLSHNAYQFAMMFDYQKVGKQSIINYSKFL